MSRLIDKILTEISYGYQEGKDFSFITMSAWDYKDLVKEYVLEFDLNPNKRISKEHMEDYLAMKININNMVSNFELCEAEDMEEDVLDNFREIDLDFDKWL